MYVFVRNGERVKVCGEVAHSRGTVAVVRLATIGHEFSSPYTAYNQPPPPSPPVLYVSSSLSSGMALPSDINDRIIALGFAYIVTIYIQCIWDIIYTHVTRDICTYVCVYVYVCTYMEPAILLSITGILVCFSSTDNLTIIQ